METGLHADIYYLPQRPYNVIGTLRENLTYPLAVPSAHLPHERVVALLEMVGLGHLAAADRAGEEGVNWEERLSLGEQQRMAIARLFYHKPRFCVLDECTSALPESMEEVLYRACERHGITYVTICHRPALEAYHRLNVHLTGQDGQWRLRALPASAPFLNRAREEKDEGDGLAASSPMAASQSSDAADADAAHRRERSAQYARLAERAPLPRRSGLQRVLALAQLAMGGTRLQLAGLVLAIALRTVAHEAASRIAGLLFRNALRGDARGFALVAAVNAAHALASGAIEEAVSFVQNRLSVSWRSALYHTLSEKLMRGAMPYRLSQVDGRVGS